jgi:endonuclease YncB( thermonuclease family)
MLSAAPYAGAMATISPFRRPRKALWGRTRRSPPTWFKRSGGYSAAADFIRNHAGFIALAFLAAGALLLRADPVSLPSVLRLDARAVDGDTLRQQRQRIRLYGIDAPELHQNCTEDGRAWDCGGAAKAQLAYLVARGPITCTSHGEDRYGRTIATCTSDADGDIGEAMVREGYAIAYASDAYTFAQSVARHQRRGIWRGHFESPHEWGRSHPRTQGNP